MLKLKTMIKAIAEFSQIARQVFVIKGMVNTDDGVFDITNHCVHPGKFFVCDTLWTATRNKYPCKSRLTFFRRNHTDYGEVNVKRLMLTYLTLLCWQPASLTAVKQAKPSETTCALALR
ncbi:Uncharacterised protein [Candidatus Venteria ishoeyi]|uniref:Uncharacterized protein n=1 Tax=Candidatus Venteria ishoeyi TaxID=1899563 RepID=A0A1H6F838_9GAMM|nr:Uncharacterised protein [Candidatus Venteria ishoeyi]